jgi:hypothetical protein
MLFWDQETMTRKNRAMIQKSERDLVFKNQPSGYFAPNNPAE